MSDTEFTKEIVEQLKKEFGYEDRPRHFLPEEDDNDKGENKEE